MIRFLKNFAYSTLSRKARFSRIFHNNTWNCDESVSGSGSTLDATETLRAELPVLLKKLKIGSMLDAPCGDAIWMESIIRNLDSGQTYIGMDIVPDLISINATKFDGKNIRFLVGDIVEDSLPKVDLIMCKDCFMHLSYSDIRKALLNFKASDASYLLIDTRNDAMKFHDIQTGRYRFVNLEKPPFRFPEPIQKISCDEVQNKYMSLWKLNDLPDISASYSS